MRRRLLSLAAFALLISGMPQTPARAAETLSVFRPAGRGGSLLPAGWLSTRGSRLIDGQGNTVRIASIGWYGTDGPAGHALQGLWTVSYRAICDSIVAAGFNTVRIPWSDVNLDVQPKNTRDTGTIDFAANRQLRGLTTWWQPAWRCRRARATCAPRRDPDRPRYRSTR